MNGVVHFKFLLYVLKGCQPLADLNLLLNYCKVGNPMRKFEMKTEWDRCVF